MRISYAIFGKKPGRVTCEHVKFGDCAPPELLLSAVVRRAKSLSPRFYCCPCFLRRESTVGG